MGNCLNKTKICLNDFYLKKERTKPKKPLISLRTLVQNDSFKNYPRTLLIIFNIFLFIAF